jgi:RNA polymerase-binding transcription factor DksA
VVDILESEVRDQLARVDHAIERIHAGVGEICARCQSIISEARLKALPETTLCADCASGQE